MSSARAKDLSGGSEQIWCLIYRQCGEMPGCPQGLWHQCVQERHLGGCSETLDNCQEENPNCNIYSKKNGVSCAAP
jgi:hypothetical protein